MLKEDDAVEQLEAFQIGEKKTALQSLVTLGKVGDYIDEISKLLDDEEAAVRKETALTLGKIGANAGHKGQSVARMLASSLQDEDKSVRAEVARAIAALGKEGVAVAEKVENILGKDKEDESGMAAVECLSTLGQVSRLGPFLKHASPHVTRVALVEAGRSPEARKKFAQVILERTSHQDTSVRLAAVQATGEIGNDCTQAHLEALAGLCSSDKQPKVRRAAVQALGKVGPRVAPYLVTFFHDSDEGVRHFAAETLGSVGGEPSAEAATELADHSDPAVRRAAIMALGRLKVDGRDRSGLIAKHLNDEDFAARLEAIQALSTLGATEEARKVGALSQDPNKGIRQAAVNCLAHMGKDGAEEAVPFLDDPDAAVRQAAVRVYSPLHSKLAADLALPYAPRLCGKLGDEDWRVRFAAVVGLGDLHTRQFANEVALLCNDDNNQVRRSAVTTLVKINATAAHVAAFFGDDDKGVVKDAEQAYTQMKTSGQEEEALSECD